MATAAAPVLGLAAGLRPPHQPCWSPACPPPWGKAPRVCQGSHFEGWGKGKVEPPPREACRRTPPKHSSAHLRDTVPQGPPFITPRLASAPLQIRVSGPCSSRASHPHPSLHRAVWGWAPRTLRFFFLDLSEILNTHPCPFLGSSGRFRAEPGLGPALGQIKLGVQTISMQ